MTDKKSSLTPLDQGWQRSEKRGLSPNTLSIRSLGNDADVFPQVEISNSCETNQESDAMAFINEPINAEDQERIQYSTLRDPQNGGRIPSLPRWTVDRERDAFLLRLGGGMSREDYHVPYYFLFSWNGRRMRVDALQLRTPSTDPTRTVLTWKVLRLHLPEVFTGSHEEVLITIAEALTAHGSTSYDDTRSMYAEFLVDFSNVQLATIKGE